MNNDLPFRLIGVNGLGKAKQEIAAKIIEKQKRKEQDAINKAESFMLRNKLVTMDKARYYIRTAVEILRAKDIPITTMRVYNAALGQGGWSK